MISKEHAYMTENKVIARVVSKLGNLDFSIISTCNTKEHGVDIVAEKGNIKLLIEAKGETSSMENSKRNGLPFSRNQAKTHISVALYTAMQLLSKYSGDINYIIGIALPCERNHIEFIEMVEYAINKLGIIVFWVKGDEVEIHATDVLKGYFL